ncbi:MAG TPA: DUF2298 domain-containing protein [Chloroflexota bacterium]|nr:DUF2298 domain-containing protein [Chloroflexota bacterium]
MIWFLSWLLAVEAAGVAALPLSVRLLRALPDRGFFFSKPLGILLIGYLCWLPSVLGMLRFQQSTVVAVLVIVAASSWMAWGREAFKQLSTARFSLVFSELTFLLALGIAAAIRASFPDISGTEKPMDFAFLNAVARTETLPPEDPWLSGFGISYYYFGYYLLGMLVKLSGIQASVGYNLSVALVFAMLVAGSYSIAFNLLSSLRPDWPLPSRLAGAVLAPVLVAVMGNLEIALEVLASKGYSNPSFWQWAGIKNLHPSPTPGGPFPTDFWWWWRASRVIPTTTPDGINEFPFFSFLLGDLHPHFTALPWVLLTVATSFAAMMKRVAGSMTDGWWPTKVVSALILGFPLVGNSWDYPTYAGLYIAACLVPFIRRGWKRESLADGIKLALPVIAASIAMYSPFFLGFSSQTRGLGLSADRTPLVSMLIIFGALLSGIVVLLSWRGWTGKHDPGIRTSPPRTLVVAGLLLLLAAPVGGSLALLAGVLLLGLSAVVRFYSDSEPPAPARGAQLFLLLLAALGLALIVIPEFVFLMDLFGTRMNTVFKFHYQAWLLLGIGSGVGVVWTVGTTRRRVAAVAAITPFALMVGIGLLYPVGATASRTQDSSTQATLDGAAFFQVQRPDEYSAIQWLARNASGRPVVMEATGGSYSSYARVSTFSGLPTVLGWASHEVQWGRNGAELQRRTQDIDAVYSTASRDSIVAILRKYQVVYLFVGSLEVEKYGPALSERFSGLLEPAYRQGNVVIYRVPPAGRSG